MSVEVERATVACSVCRAQVTELRRGRCWGCYTRWNECRPVGRGASCTVCAEKRRDELKLVELGGRSLPFCHGCAARLARLDEIPATVDDIRRALRRDRRDGDQRIGKLDHRIFPRERRVGERRGPPRGERHDTDPHLRLDDFEEMVVELDSSDLEEIEQTMVRGEKRG
jgi:hypothetical protein